MMQRRRSRLARIAVLAPGLLAVGCTLIPGNEPAPEESAAVFRTQRADLAVSVPAKGYLEALSASPIAVPRVPTGALKVRELVPEGSLIAAGEIVVIFDDSELNIDLENQNATFRSTNLRIDRTQLQSDIEAGAIGVMKEVAALERDNADEFHILDESIYSKLEILETAVQRDDAEATILFADASLLLRGEYYDIEERILGVEKNQVAGNIDRAKVSLGNLVLRAPIGGMIVYKKNWRGASVAVGDTIWPGNMIMSIVDPASTALTAFLLERDAAGVQVGSAATVTVDARPDRVFQGKVHTIAELSRPIERGSPVKYFEVKVAIDGGDPTLLKPGMKGETRIALGNAQNAVVIPRSAVRGEGDERYVLVSGVSGNERRPVTLGLGDQVRVIVQAGLEGDERVLLGGGDGDPTTEPEARPAAAAGDVAAGS